MAGSLSKLQQLSKIFVFLQVLWTAHCATVAGSEPTSPPRFLAPVTNYTAAVGKTADLKCQVNKPSKYKVAWFHMDRKMLLSIHTTIVTRIPRFSVTRDDETTWTLHIQSVTREDKGQYMCQVNTEPILNQVGYLNVVVPPVIVDSLSSGSSVVVQENGNVTLTCQAEGNPEPSISWMREDQKHITFNKRRKVQKHEGSTLVLKKVSRRDMGAYLCIASNRVPPTVSKRIELKVQFAPIVLLPNQLMSAPRGSSVGLECKTEAYPRAVTFWKHNDTMVMSTHKYKLDEIHHDDYTTTVKLIINKLDKNDFGKYLCYSRNSFGENDGTVELHELNADLKREKSNQKMSNNIEAEEINLINHYPLDREGGHGQSRVILDRDDSGILGSDNNNMKNELSKGVEQKSQLGHERPGHNNIFTSIMSGSDGVSVTPLGSMVVLTVAVSALHSQIAR
ncbi:lachesin-like [Palaemon carinicauda]|uniref:lachesin-like n=1 Tax=Palaemon carinicauda TaxID=392227 RepID=UPI0035B62E75